MHLVVLFYLILYVSITFRRIQKPILHICNSHFFTLEIVLYLITFNVYLTAAEKKKREEKRKKHKTPHIHTQTHTYGWG
ncbi:hypothetical protein BDZ91DRAFT_738848 [Kalaharituber pfeilii]|nr:hypothetical protein BDZ91DRAFT_738848 [Kalaharituber pfeilii]